MSHAAFIVLLAAGSSPLDEKVPNTTLAEPTAEHGSPVLFSWADADGDGRLDLAAVSPEGVLQLLESAGDGRFEDVTVRAGLSQVAGTALALWADYDSDGRLDLFVGVRQGVSRLFRNEGGVFVDMTEGSGLSCEGAVRSADWLDHDGDGRPDLHVLTAERHELYRGLEGGFFERTELPLAGTTLVPAGNPLVSVGMDAESPEGPVAVPMPSSAAGSNRSRREAGGLGVFSGGHTAPAPSASGGSSSALLASCLPAIRDQASPSTCIQASTTPALGKLFPISSNLFVAVGGDVGIGTTTPAARLHVAGTARITDTLALAPSGDQALDVSTGSIYKGGALFIHTKGGLRNTALGRDALSSLTSGFANTAGGTDALRSNTNGARNTASGAGALRYNTIGSYNTASGADALRANTYGLNNTATGDRALTSNTTGTHNTANGANALRFNTGDGNTASGAGALRYNTSGFLNTASGMYALGSNTTGHLNVAIGGTAMRSNTTGARNTAGGHAALYGNTSGSYNTASGYLALFYNTTGSFGTASGAFALRYNTTGTHNTAAGYSALMRNTTGQRNIGLGNGAGSNLTTGNDNIDIGNSGVAAESATIRIGTAGTQTRAFIAGIRGVTTGLANAIPVLVDGAGQLGTVSSSRRFKKDIADMGDATERLLELRPVVFHYEQEQELPGGGEVPFEYGLIAEEVAEVFPELVVHDEEGRPFTVKYHLLSSMLLNELQKLRSELTRLRGLEARVEALEARTSSLPADSATGRR